ncbi:MAG TPA: FtsX-like permease family protein [Verrucomicrobiae bacterium]|nr:FtsX-like permease family protein [Verrucomicrobiae bacterium]
MRYVPLILKNCWRNRRRTILTVASIGVSMCLLGVLIAMYHAFYMGAPAPDQAMRLVVRNRVSITQAIPLSYRDRIRRIPGVQHVMLANWFQGVYKDARDPKNFFARFAVDPTELFQVYGEYRIPEDQKQAFLHDRAGCVIGRDLVNTFHFKIGDRIPITGDIFPGQFEFTVRGIFDSPLASDVLYFDREYLDQSMSERRRGAVGMYYVRIDDPSHSGRIAEAIDAEFHNSTAQTKTESEQAFTVGFLALLGNVKMFMIAIAGAVTFTILLVSANTMAMSVRERVREIGVLKTLGFTRGTVLGLILGEACGISVAGGLIGYLISMLLMQAVAKSPFGGFLPAMQPFELPVALTAIGIAGFIGLISSLVPAIGASRLSIVEALRSAD